MKSEDFIKYHSIILLQNKKTKNDREQGRKSSKIKSNQKAINIDLSRIYKSFRRSKKIIYNLIVVNSNYFIYLLLLLYKRIEKRYNNSMKYL